MAARPSLLAPDLLGRHVLTKSDELRVTVIVGGPFKEIDHFDQDRSQPLAVLHIRRREAGAPDRSWLQADLRTHDSLIMTGRRAGHVSSRVPRVSWATAPGSADRSPPRAGAGRGGLRCSPSRRRWRCASLTLLSATHRRAHPSSARGRLENYLNRHRAYSVSGSHRRTQGLHRVLTTSRTTCARATSRPRQGHTGHASGLTAVVRTHCRHTRSRRSTPLSRRHRRMLSHAVGPSYSQVPIHFSLNLVLR